jgi:hypothetical protein
MDKALVAQRLANQLASTENAVDAAMKETTQLLSGMLDARQELKTSAVFGDVAATKVTDAIAALAAARQSVIDAHNEMAELKLRAGIRTKLIVGDKLPSFLAADREAGITARRAG